MRNFSIETLIILLVLVGSIWAVTFNFYMAWFRPSEFLERAAKAVSNWWPFAGYFRSLYGSSKWLWTVRIASTLFMLFFIFIIFQVLISLLDV